MTLEIIALGIPAALVYTTAILVGLRLSDRWLYRHFHRCPKCYVELPSSYSIGRNYFCKEYDSQYVRQRFGSAFWPIALFWLGILRPVGRLLVFAANGIANLIDRPKPAPNPSRVQQLEQELKIGEW